MLGIAPNCNTNINIIIIIITMIGIMIATSGKSRLNSTLKFALMSMTSAREPILAA